MGGTDQHVDVVHQVQGQECQLHDEVRVVHIGAFGLPCSLMVQVPQVEGVPKETVWDSLQAKKHSVSIIFSTLQNKI